MVGYNRFYNTDNTLITIYALWGDSDAKQYLKNKYNISDEKASEIIQNIIQSDRYKKYVKSAEVRMNHDLMLEEYKRNNISYKQSSNEHLSFSNSSARNLTKNSNKKKNTMVFIDAESVGADKCESIIEKSEHIGEIFERRYYARQKDESVNAWKEKAKKYDIKPILLYGEPEKNKIDNKIIKDIEAVLRHNKSIDVFCLVTRDGDYAEIVEKIKEYNKKACVFAVKDTSEKLKHSASKVIDI